MSKQIVKLLVAVAIVSTAASPAFAQKRSEYNFNTCNYNFYGQANPMNGQGAAGGPVSFYKGQGVTNAQTTQLRNGMNALIYQQTPQKTLNWDNMKMMENSMAKPVQQQQVYRPVQQQQQQYFYVPGQNGGGQNQSQSGVGYQFNSSGAASYSYNSNNNSAATYSSGGNTTTTNTNRQR